MGLPYEEGLGGAGFIPRFSRGFQFRVFKTWCKTCVNLVVPAAAHAPSRFTVFAHDFPRDLIGGGGFPATGFEVKGADFASGVVFDFHGSVIVDGGRACDDADDGAGDFLPRVEFFAAGSGTELEEPGAKGVDVERFTIEL